jgi:hypothetical protein
MREQINGFKFVLIPRKSFLISTVQFGARPLKAFAFLSSSVNIQFHKLNEHPQAKSERTSFAHEAHKSSSDDDDTVSDLICH